ncbi:hypothetical protein ACVKSY_001592 [Sphingomonas sp. PvP107]
MATRSFSMLQVSRMVTIASAAIARRGDLPDTA